jgi:hypothetical protein
MSNKKKPNFNLTFKDYSKQQTLCLLSMSDAWQRGATFDKPSLASEFNLLSKNLCASTIDANLLKGDDKISKNVKSSFDKLIDYAEENGIQRIILPIQARSDYGRFLKKNCINQYNGKVKIELQSKSYQGGLDHIGKIDKRRKTSFDYGMAKIKSL